MEEEEEKKEKRKEKQDSRDVNNDPTGVGVRRLHLYFLASPLSSLVLFFLFLFSKSYFEKV